MPDDTCYLSSMADIPSDTLREAIKTCGLTRYRIAKATGISEGVLTRFMQGKGINTDTIDRLAPVVGFTVVVRKTKRRTGGKDG